MRHPRKYSPKTRILLQFEIFTYFNSIGPLRFAAPQPPLYYPEIQTAKEYGPGCLQQTLVLNPDVGLPSYDLRPNLSSEDCEFHPSVVQF